METTNKYSDKQLEEFKSLILKKIEKHHQNSDYNQNYYGIIRKTSREIDYYCFDSKNMTLCEINTLSDYDRVIEEL